MAADHFENIARTLLEAEGYWVAQSFKVNVTKEEKRQIGKHSIPRPEGRYKLFTSENYRHIVLSRLKADLLKLGMANDETKIRLGLIIGNVYPGDALAIRRHAQFEGWLYWSPRLLRRKLRAQARRSYENDPAIIVAKLLLR